MLQHAKQLPYLLFTLSIFACASLPVAQANDGISAIDQPHSAALNTFLSAKSIADYTSALEQFKDLYKANPKHPDIAFYYGRSLYHSGQFEAADKVLSKNIEAYPDHFQSHYVLGSVKLSRVADVNLFRKASMAKAAITAWERTVELRPDHVEALYGVVEFYFIAPGFAGGDEKVAEQKLLELNVLSEPWANLTRASRALKAESFEEAEQLFKLAIEGIPNRAFPQMMLANLHIKKEEFELALDALNTYKRREHTWNDPGPAQTELMAAKIYQGLKQTDKAIESVQIALNTEPTDAIRKQAEDLLKDLK